MNEHTKTILDLASVSTAVATIAGWMPSVAALVSIVWGLIRIYETRTVQAWLKGKR